MAALIWCPFPDEASAESAASVLLDERLVACANMIAGVRSLFTWQGERGQGDEVGVLFKTDARVLDQAVVRLEMLHPYDAPAIMGWRCDAAGVATAQWLGELAETTQ